MITTITTTGYYLTIRQIAEQQNCSVRHITDEVKEMKNFIGTRYEPEEFVDDEKKVHQYAILDFQKYRKSLLAGLRVPEFNREKWAILCPVVERYEI